MADVPTRSAPDPQQGVSDSQRLDRLVDEFARVADGFELLRKLLLVGGVIVIVLIVIGVIIEVDMLRLVTQIRGVA